MEISKLTRTQKWIGIIIVSSLLIAGLSQTIYRFLYLKELKICKKQIGTCTIYNTNYMYIKTSGLWVSYWFNVNGQIFKDRSNLGLIYKDTLKDILIGKQFPVVYCRQDPSKSEVLISPEFFQKFGYPFPDSLLWLHNYLK